MKDGMIAMSFSARMGAVYVALGLAMGLCFPIYADFFVNYKSGMKTYFILGCIVAGIMVGLLNYVIYKIQTRKLVEKLTSTVKQIADGDFSQSSVQIQSADEIGMLSSSINRMKVDLRALIQTVAFAADKVTNSSEKLTSSSEQSSLAANQVASSITQMSKGAATQLSAAQKAVAIVAEMSSDIIRVTASTNQAAQKVDQTSDVARSGLQSLNRAVSQMGRMEDTVNHSAATVSKLGERSKEVGQIVDTISGIAGQTNLLALNAAIEAARAGEQGRGFAVVAEEVRKLAEQSQSAAKEIAALISEIQGDTGQAIAAMNDGIVEVKAGTEVVRAAGQSFSEIASLVEELSGTIQGISTMVQQVSGGSRSVVSSVEEISTLSNKVASESETVSAATQQQLASMEVITASSKGLEQMAQELKNAVLKFKV